MKKYAIAVLGLMLAAAPAYADSIKLNQTDKNNTVGNADSARALTDLSNQGVSDSTIDSSQGIVTSNINAGTAANVGSIAEITGLNAKNGSQSVGSPFPSFFGTAVIEAAKLNQVNTNNNIGNATDNDATAYVNSDGVDCSHISNSAGIVTQQINTGYASNVGSVSAISVR